MAVGALVRNEIQKTWRSRWLVFAVFFGLLVLVSLGLYGFYVHQTHRWSPPPPTPWQQTLQANILQDQRTLANLEKFKQQNSGGRVESGPFARAQAQSIDKAISQTEQGISDNQYLLDNNITPVQSNPLGFASIFALGGIIIFLLTRIFGWLASELVAGERSDRTIAILLSRPASRDQVLLSKSVAMFLIELGVAVLTLLLAYVVLSFFAFGTMGPLDGQVGVALDGAQPLGPNNVLVMPAPVLALMVLAAAMLAILGVQGMSLLISVLTTRFAAIGITLAVLFAAPVASALVGTLINAISPGSGDFLKYAFFNLLDPVSSVAPAVGSTPSSAGSGINVFTHQVEALAGWTIAFFAAAWFLFHRRQETG